MVISAKHNIYLSDEALHVLGNFFVNKRVLERHGITFCVFMEAWRQGKIEEYL